MTVQEQEIERLQRNLQTIRKVAGWTTAELGEQVGVTKQTISNIENRKTKMTKLQYIGLRAVIDYEIASNPENTGLAQVVTALLNSEDEERDETSEQDRIQQNIIRTMKDSSMTVTKAALIAASANPIILGTAYDWMRKIISKK